MAQAVSMNKNNINNKKEVFSYIFDGFLAILFGIMGSLAVWVFQLVIGLGERFSPQNIGRLTVFLLPALGGLIVGLVAHLAKISAGGGIVDVIAGVNVRRKVLANPKSLLKPALALVSIITGNPVGSAPVVLLGAQAAAFTTELLNLDHKRRRILIACGAGAGFAAAFAAPLTGIAFVTEIILMEFSTYSFSMIALSVGSAFLMGRLIALKPLIVVPTIPKFSFKDMLICLLIGVLCALTALVWTRLMNYLHRQTRKYGFLTLWGPCIGGLIIGITTIFAPGAWGPGYNVVNSFFTAKMSFLIVMVLFTSKLIGTSFALGLGGAGGDLAPTIFLGGCIGLMCSWLSPGSTAIFVISGVCAQLAAAIHAPLSAGLLSIEVSSQLVQVFPVMISSAVASLVSIRIIPRSLFADKAHDQGIVINKGQFQNPLETQIREVMTTNVVTIEATKPVLEAIKLMKEHNLAGLPVTSRGKLFGIITLSDLRNKVTNKSLGETVAFFCSRDLIIAFPSTTLEEAWQSMRENEIGRLMVVSESNNEALIGMVTKRDLLELATRRNVEPA